MSTNQKQKRKLSSNLASEYYVASLLFRLGYEASITLGNTKEIDLIVYDPETNKKITIDVKGLKNTTDWIMPKNPSQRSDHFYILVSFKNRISELDTLPEVYVIPAQQVTQLWVGWVGKEEVRAIKYSDLKKHPELKGKEGMKLLFK